MFLFCFFAQETVLGTTGPQIFKTQVSLLGARHRIYERQLKDQANDPKRSSKKKDSWEISTEQVGFKEGLEDWAEFQLEGILSGEKGSWG